MMRWLGVTSLVCLLSACNVASVREAPSTIAHNECENNGDCDTGLCEAKQCRSRAATYQNLLFEVTPPADGSISAGAQFLIPKKDLSDSSVPLQLELEQISQVTGEVKAKLLNCMPVFGDVGKELAKAFDSSVPAQVSLIRTPGTLGLYSPRAVVQAELRDDTYFGFSVNVPPGPYDIYVQPIRQPTDSCPVPPLLLRGQDIPKGIFPLEIGLPAPSVFEFHVTWPAENAPLDGWMVDMLDPKSGRVLSNRVQLLLEKGSKTDYRATLSYNPVLVARPNAPPEVEVPTDQVVRLSPPDGLPDSQPTPTVLMARSALALFSPGSGTLTSFTALPTPVHVIGEVTARNTPQRVAANITLVATEITGIDRGVLTSFTRSVNVSEDGRSFDVYLLPGKYRVSTVPQSPLDPGRGSETPLAADTRYWTVPSSPEQQEGKVIELGDALAINGRVVDASDGPVATAQVQAAASPQFLSEPNFLQESLGGAAYAPRASASDVSGNGDFALKTDPGTFDITVRPNSNTGFAWLVMPNILVDSPTAGVSLGTIRMPLPFPYHGTVTAGGTETPNVVPGALVRAYIYLKGDQYTPESGEADSVLQVAETRTDKDGAFDVLIPAELNRQAVSE